MTLDYDLFRGEKTCLARLTEQDLAVVACWYEDSTFLRLFDSRPAFPKTAAELQVWVEDMHKSPDDFVFAVRPLDNDVCIGYLELDGINWVHGVSGLALGIGNPACRGKGYGTDATLLALRYAFQELNLHRVTATVFSYNTPSLAMCDKIGFTREGAFREYLQRDGQRFDMLLLGMLRHEWLARYGDKG